MKSSELTKRVQKIYSTGKDEHDKTVKALCNSKVLHQDQLLKSLAEDVKKNPNPVEVEPN